MTEELKQKAEEWVKHNSDESIHSFDGEQLQKAYIAGATENGIQWHDLRKDPNDLPKKEGKNKFESVVVYISYSDGDTDFAYYEFPHKEWYRLFGDEPTIPPIVWCEIPQFKE